jgi:hypothetical protein
MNLRKGNMVMKKKDLMSVAVVAVGTATLTVAGFLANPIEAGGGADGPATAIATPKLAADGVELTLTPAQGRVFQTGDQPAFELHAVNTLPQATTVKVCVTMTATDPAGMFSRIMRPPAELWREDQLVALKANETRTVLLQANTNLPANRQFFVSLSVPSAQGIAATDIAATSGQSRVSMTSPPGQVLVVANSIAAPVRAIMALTFSTIPPKPAPAPASVSVIPVPGTSAGGAQAPVVAAGF